jgi:hypothetical protein
MCTDSDTVVCSMRQIDTSEQHCKQYEGCITAMKDHDLSHSLSSYPIKCKIMPSSIPEVRIVATSPDIVGRTKIWFQCKARGKDDAFDMIAQSAHTLLCEPEFTPHSIVMYYRQSWVGTVLFNLR